MDYILLLLPTIAHFRLVGYLIIFLIAFAESLAFIGLLIPGTVFLFGIGVLASHGFIDVYDAFWFATAGAVIGDGVSFYLGKKGKILFKPENRIFKTDYLEKSQAYFASHGSKSVFFGRFIGPIRPIIPFVAGLSKMDTKRFFIFNIASALGWSAFFLFAGFGTAQVWTSFILRTRRIRRYAPYIIILIALLAMAGRAIFLRINTRIDKATKKK